MFDKSKVIEVSISNQILWIGEQAFSVPNITLVSTKEVKYRGVRSKYFFKMIFSAIFGLIVLAVLAAVAKGVVGQQVAVVNLALTLIGALLVARIIWLTIRLIWLLTRGKYYQLIIGTAGAHVAVLSSNNEYKLKEIVRQITEAMNNPAAAFFTKIENFDLSNAKGVQFGDNAKQVNSF